MLGKVAIITLGCAKNTVDSEQIASKLREEGFEICSEASDAEAVVINTCGFIEEAKEQSVDAIFEALDIKSSGGTEKIIVTGCLSKRYGDELAVEIPEVDVYCSIDPQGAARAVLEVLGISERCVSSDLRRIHRFTPGAWAYLRVSEGCDNRCSYCAIPMIRGPLKSRPESDILREASYLAGEGVKELNLIAQDTTAYNLDRGRPRLHKLLESMCEDLPHIWIRLLYTHPAHYYPDLVEVIAQNKQICPYLDIPLQHINDDILQAMGRGVDRRDLETLISTLRSEIPGLTLRTTFMVGFPGEGEEEFRELLQFAEITRFDRAGVFVFSKEEDTPACSLGDDIPEKVKNDRYNRLMSCQRGIASEKAAERVGEITPVLIESKSSESPKVWEGRSPHEAPEVDPLILIDDSPGLHSGQFVEARITGSEEYDCTAERIL